MKKVIVLEGLRPFEGIRKEALTPRQSLLADISINPAKIAAYVTRHGLKMAVAGCALSLVAFCAGANVLFAILSLFTLCLSWYLTEKGGLK